MSVPLPKSMHSETLSPKGNRGLLWNKFFDQWATNFNEVRPASKIDKVAYHGGKMNWVLAQCYPRVRQDGLFRVGESERKAAYKIGDTALLAAANRRQAALVQSLAGKSMIFETSGPFVSGTGLAHPVENGFLFHHSLGVPYLPGSSIKGMVRAWAEHWLEEDKDFRERILRLFGRSSDDGSAATGNLIVFDAIPTAPIALTAEIVTPHTGDWRITATPENSPPADWVSPNPIPFLAVESGTSFQFALAMRIRPDEANDDLDFAWTCLQDALDWIGAGARTAAGFGRFTSAATRQRRTTEIADIKARLAMHQEEAERNWVPAINDTVNYADEKHWIVSIEGDDLVVRDDRGKQYPAGLDEVKPWKGG